jgi:hypothetical protein
MLTAKVARMLSGEYNENFNELLKEVQNAALLKKRDINLNLPYYEWVQKIGFHNFKEVMSALGFEVFDNQTSFKIRW